MKPILIGATIIPVIFFVSGMFFGQMLNGQPPEITTIPPENKVTVISQPETLEWHAEPKDAFPDKILTTETPIDEP